MEERSERDAAWRGLKVEEGAESGGCGKPLEAGKGEAMGPPLAAREGVQSWRHLDFCLRHARQTPPTPHTQNRDGW